MQLSVTVSVSKKYFILNCIIQRLLQTYFSTFYKLGIPILYYAYQLSITVLNTIIESKRKKHRI